MFRDEQHAVCNDVAGSGKGNRGDLGEAHTKVLCTIFATLSLHLKILKDALTSFPVRLFQESIIFLWWRQQTPTSGNAASLCTAHYNVSLNLHHNTGKYLLLSSLYWWRKWGFRRVNNGRFGEMTTQLIATHTHASVSKVYFIHPICWAKVMGFNLEKGM